MIILLLSLTCHLSSSLSSSEQQGLDELVALRWLSEAACKVPHVTCVEGHVVELNFSSKGLVDAYFPQSLTFFNHLVKLDLSFNEFSQCGCLEARKEVTMASCAFSKLIYLQDLRLSSNNLNCDLEFLRNLTSLTVLYADNNVLYGDLRPLAHMKQLTALHLGNNELNGSLSFLCNLTLLTYLDLSSNFLSGGLQGIQNLSSLNHLYLWSNELEGDLSHTIEKFSSLVDLSLYDNRFTGSLLPLENLTSLRLLDLDLNRFSGSLQPLSNFPFLEGIFLWNNDINGTLEPLAMLTHLGRISIENNSLSGDLSWLKSLTKLTWLFLDDNYLHGSLDPLQNLTNLNRLTIAANSLDGNLWSLQKLRNLTRVDMSENRLYGSLTPLKTALKLKFLNLSHNQISSIDNEDRIDEEEDMWISFPGIVLLDLSFNAFENTRLTALQLNPTGSVALFRGDQAFSCPLPQAAAKMAFVHDPCLPNEEVFLPFVIGLPSLLLFFSVLIVCLHKTRCWKTMLRHRRSRKGKFVTFCIIFSLSAQDFTLDVLFMIRILKDLQSGDFCAPVNDVAVFPYLLPWNLEYNGKPFPVDFTSFPSYLEQVNLYFPGDVEAIRTDFRIQCELLAESSPLSVWAIFKPATCSCVYQNDQCVYKPSTENPFRIVVLVVIALSSTKEMLKILVICVALIKGYIPHRLCHFVLNSVLAPLLKLRPQLFDKMINYQPAASDFLFALVYDGLCEDFVQLFVAVYFAQFVSQTGLDWLGYLSISSTTLSTIVLLARALAAYCSTPSNSHSRRRTAKPAIGSPEFEWSSSISFEESEFEFNRLDDS